MIAEDILSSSTAVALLNAGIDQFGQYGLKATTRNVAEKANANIAAIPYYFRSKKGLYNACMHYIVDNIWDSIGNKMNEFQLMSEKAGGRLTQGDAKTFYLGLMESFCDFFLSDPDTLNWAQFIMREHTSPTEAYHIFYQRYYKQMQHIKLQLLGTCLGLTSFDKLVKIKSHAIFGQVLGFLVARESLLQGLEQDDLDNTDIEMIKSVIQQHTQAIIESA